MMIFETMPFSDGTEVVIVREVLGTQTEIENIAKTLNTALRRTVIVSTETGEIVVCKDSNIVG